MKLVKLYGNVMKIGRKYDGKIRITTKIVYVLIVLLGAVNLYNVLMLGVIFKKVEELEKKE